MLWRIDVDWQTAITRHKYQSPAARNALLRLWQFDKVKMTAACAFLIGMSFNTQREWIQTAIKEGVLECDNDELTQTLRSGGKVRDRRGKNSPNVWLSAQMRSEVDLYLDHAVIETRRAIEKF